MPTLSIFYGTELYKKNVTDICMNKLLSNDTIVIPAGDHIRANYFTDPIYGYKKYVYVTFDDDTKSYDDSYIVKINVVTSTVTIQNDNNIISTLQNIHKKLNIKYGSLEDELPEQKMVVRYLTGNENVLEIGGNIGRNSLVISSIIDSNNLVVLESDENIAKQLMENRNINSFSFNVEPSALSKRKLIQRGWDTKPSDILENGYNWVKIISYEELCNKYVIPFDTLILDCEGAFYYILLDMPEVLDNIKIIIMENDYHDISHKLYIDSILKQNQFTRDYVEAGGWGPCYDYFFEVWKK